jgi:arsenate reductase-like glutaredoxin family protein
MYELYTKDDCARCVEAKEFLLKNQLSFKEHVIGKDITQDEVRKLFPRVFVLPVILKDGFRITNLDELRVKIDQEKVIRLYREL